MASFGNLAKRKHSFKTPIGLLATLVLASALAVPLAPSASAETVLKGCNYATRLSRSTGNPVKYSQTVTFGNPA